MSTGVVDLAAARDGQPVVRPIGGCIGAQIDDVDLAVPLGEQTRATVVSALERHRVIFFRAQSIGPSELVAFGRQLGTVLPAHPTLAGHPEVLELSTETYGPGLDMASVMENRWHTDATFLAEPPFATILHAVQVPELGGDTGWVNTAAAYEALSEPIRRLIDPLSAVHRNMLHLELGSAQGAALAEQFMGTVHEAVHPVVRVHPTTGDRVLYVNPQFTSHIVGLSNRESRAILAMLFEHMTDPRFSVRFHWEPGSVACWDNRATAHLAAFDLQPGSVRVLHRITLAGDAPVGPGRAGEHAPETLESP
jgi:alpha-ketoglutarate-dependent sulfate ester dioxygenase